MSLGSASSLTVPDDPILGTDGLLYDRSEILTVQSSHFSLDEASRQILPTPNSTSPTLGTTTRNVGMILSLMRPEMDRIILENFSIKAELAQIERKFANECELKEKAKAVITTLQIN